MKVIYGEGERLLPNQEYHLSLSVKNEPLKSVTFTSRYSPAYSTVRIIRSDFRTLFQDYTDIEIYQLIHMNSTLANEIASTEIGAEIPFYAKQYVRYKTELDMVTDLMIQLSSQSGSKDKSLGELRIANQYSAPKLDGIMKLLERRLMTWEVQLAGVQSSPSSAVRAGDSEFPLNGRLF